MMNAQLIHAKADLRFTLQNYYFFINPQVFFSNRNEPNLAQTFRMLRMGSVRDCLTWHQQVCHTEPARRVYLCLRIGRALFIPCLCLVYALFMPSIWVVCTLYGVECDMRAAMSCPRWPVQWLASVAAVFLSFSLERKGPKVQGRHHGPTTLGNRPSPMSAVSRAPNPVGLWRSHTRNKGGKQHKWTTLPPLAVIAGLSPFKGGARRAGDYGPAISYALGIHPCRRFASSRGTKRSIYARFM